MNVDEIEYSYTGKELIRCLHKKITSIVIPDSVTSIIRYAFSGCTRLASITIPDSVTYIDSEAFTGCTSLTTFYVKESNAAFVSENGILFNKDKTKLICYPAGKSGEYSIPHTVTSIESCAFSGSTHLTSITLPNSVTSIGHQAFKGCISLSSITIPDSVTYIDSEAFTGCTSLTTFYVKESNAAFVSENGILFNKDKTKLICYPAGKSGEYSIPHTVTSIGSHAFKGCTSLISVTIPDSVISIESDAFSGCTSLKSIVLPNSVTSLGDRAFEGCASLSSITIPDSITSICSDVFSGCTALTSIVLPNSVTSLGDRAFEGCASLSSITIPDSITSIGSDAFNSCTALSIVNFNAVSCTDLDCYSPIFHNAGTSGNGIVVTFGNSVTKIPAYLFNGCAGLTGIILPNSVTSIGKYAFNGCTSLTSVTIPNSVTFIGAKAFKDCTALIEINFNPISCDDFTLDSDIFSNAGMVGEGIAVTFGGSVVNIPANLFYGRGSSHKSRITSITIGNLVRDIRNSAFRGCSLLTSITIPDSVSSIGAYAFEGCTSLSSIYVDHKNVAYCSDNGVLFNKNQTTLIYCPRGKAGAYTIPESVTSIGYHAFKGCTALTSITIGKAVNSIGIEAFKGCTSLIEVNFNAASCNHLPHDVFYNAGTSGEGIAVTFGDSVTNISANIFNVTDLSFSPKIVSVYISDSISLIDLEVFVDWISLSLIYVGHNNLVYCSDNGVLFNKNQTTLIYCPDGKAGAYRIPDSVTSIASGAFRDCTKLTSVTIPDSVTSIGERVFWGCTLLSSLDVSLDNPAYCTENGILFNRKKTAIIHCPARMNGSYCIPDSVTSIVNGAFRDCINLTSVTFPDSIRFIGDEAFCGCTGLTTLIMPGSIISIGNRAFSDCSSLKSVTIPLSAECSYDAFDENVEIIRKYASSREECF